MAQTMTGTAIGRVNRRFLLLAAILAVLFGVLAYVALSDSGGGTVTSDGIPVVVARVPIPAGTRITGDMLQVVDVPSSAVGDQPFTVAEAVVGQVARYPIRANEPLLLGDVVNTTVAASDALSYVVPEGQRGLAVNVEQVVAAGGLVLPGDHVDVLWIPFKGAPAFRLLSDVEVTAVSQTVVDIAPVAPGVQSDDPATAQPTDNQRVRTSDAPALPEAATVTLLVSPGESATLFCAEDFARKSEGSIRLALRSFGDTAPANIDAPPCPPLDLMLELGNGA